ncbi:sodium bicarbonate transporter-like protein 11, partial [Dinothrombium tinctorium]
MDSNNVVHNGDVCFVNGGFEFDEDQVGKKRKSAWNNLRSDFGPFGSVLSKLESVVSNEKPKEEILLFNSVQLLPKMLYNDEIRGLLDMKHYLGKMTILLDIRDSNLQNIIYNLVEEMATYKNSNVLLEEVKSQIFADEKKLLLAQTIRGAEYNESANEVTDKPWICIVCEVACLRKRKIGFIRLKNEMNLGRGVEHVQFILLILVPIRQKITKNGYETARIFGTLLANEAMRKELCEAKEVEQVKQIFYKEAVRMSNQPKDIKENFYEGSYCNLGAGLWENFKRRAIFYFSDFKDGICGNKTIHKTIATVFFLYFACILPCIAFGVLNASHTDNKIDAGRALIGQTFGGLAFALFGGQPLVVIGTTALCSLYIEVVRKFSDQLQVDFYAMYACVGLWNSFFVVLYSFLGISSLIRWSTRSVEEIFAMFIVVCFVVDATKDIVKSFLTDYLSPECQNPTLIKTSDALKSSACFKENSLLYLILMIGTVWLAVKIYDFNKTPYLSAKKREILSDYALPIGVVVFSFIGSFVFKDIK